MDYINQIFFLSLSIFVLYYLFKNLKNFKLFKNFLLPEFHHICGQKYSNLFVLIFLISFSILSIGIGKGLMKYLENLMDGPFVSYVSVKVPYKQSITLDNNTEEVVEFYSDKWGNLSNDEKKILKENFKLKFGLEDNPRAAYQDYERFENSNSYLSQGEKQSKIRRIDKRDKFFQELQEKDFFLSDFKNIQNEWGVIVSVDWLKGDRKTQDLKSDYPQYLNWLVTPNGEELSIPLPVIGVVPKLPNDLDMLVGQNLFQLFEENVSAITELRKSKDYLKYFIKDTTLSSFSAFKSFGFEKIPNECITFQKEGEIYKGALFQNYFSDSLSFISTKNQISEILNENIIPLYNFDNINFKKDKNFDLTHIIFKFNKDDLAKVSDLEKELEKKGIEMDMSDVEAKLNFDIFFILSGLLTFILIFFSIVSMVLYITNLVTTHINKNKKNLGTLKAFGLSNDNITFIYSFISLTIICFAFSISFFISWMFGDLLVNFFCDIKGLDDDIHFFSYPIDLLVLFFILIPFVIINFKLWRNLKNKTPGDLIYER